jgi:hypothetical protein
MLLTPREAYWADFLISSLAELVLKIDVMSAVLSFISVAAWLLSKRSGDNSSEAPNLSATF